MYRMPVRLELDRTVRVPFEHQRPVFQVISSQKSELVHALVVAEPAAAPRGRCVDRGEKIVILAPAAAIGLCPARLNQRAFLCIRELTEPARFVRRDPQII